MPLFLFAKQNYCSWGCFNRLNIQGFEIQSCNIFGTPSYYCPEMLYIHIKLSPRVTLPQIWGLWPIIQDLKNRPVLLWDLVFGYKTVNISLPDGLGGWFGWPPGVLQITHPMGPSTHPSACRGSKRVKTSPSLEPFLGQCATLELSENLSRK